MNRYRYLIFDGQYFLTRNFKQLCNYRKDGEIYIYPDGTQAIDSDKNPIHYQLPKFDLLYLARSFFQSIAKFTRDVASAEKVILVWDKYPYYSHQLLPDYKGDRFYASEDDLSELDPETDLNKIINLKFEIEALKIKQEAKYWIIRNFEKLGMKSYIRAGYEADNFAGIIARYLYETEPNKKSALVSIDSDWSYLIMPNTDHIKPRGEVVTYDRVTDWNKDIYENIDLTHYEFKSIYDALYGSHNSMHETVSDLGKSKEMVSLFNAVRNYSQPLYLKNEDLFKRQFESFDIKRYPDYDKTLQSMYYLDKGGSIKDEIMYQQFKDETGFNVSVSYYMDFVNSLNQNMYEHESIF